MKDNGDVLGAMLGSGGFIDPTKRLGSTEIDQLRKIAEFEPALERSAKISPIKCRK